MIQLRTLGAVDLRSPDGAKIQAVLAHPKRLALLVYLASASPREGGSAVLHRRDSLVGLLWPEMPEERARASLRKAVHMLRQSLGDDVILREGDEELGLVPGKVWCDATAMDAALTAGSLDEAIELYRGPFLDGFFLDDAPEFERWVEGARARWRSEAARAACRLAEAMERDGDHFAAASWARRAAAILPQDEQMLRLLLGVLDRVGDRAGAVEAYEGFARQLAAEFGDEPSAETRRLIDAIRTPHGSAPAVPPRPSPGPLPPVAAAPETHTVPSTTQPAAAKPARWRSPVRVGAGAVVVMLATAGAVHFSGPDVAMIDPPRTEAPHVVHASGLPDGFIDGALRAGEISFGVRFVGQTVAVDGDHETLGAAASSPLRILSDNVGRNLYRGNHRRYGANLSGIGPTGVRGRGALAMLFQMDQSEVVIEIVRADLGEATFQFFRRDGSLIAERRIQGIENREYAFRRRGGRADIAGVAIYNRDPDEGLSVSSIRYRASRDRPARGSPFRMAVLPFEARGGDEAAALSARVTALMSANMDGMDRMQIAHADSIRTAAEEHSVVGEAVGRGIASAANAGWFLRGSVTLDGSNVRVQAMLFGPDAGPRPIGVAELEGPRERLGWTADGLTRELLAQRYHADGRYTAEEAARSAASVAWLRSFLEGERAIETGLFGVASNMFAAAVAGDPASWVAHYRASHAAYLNHRMTDARSAATRALELRRAASLSGDREVARLEAWQALLSARGSDAERQFRALVASDGNDIDALQGLVEALMRHGPEFGHTLSDITEVAERSLRLSPRSGPMRLHLGRLSAARGDGERANFLLRTAFSLAAVEGQPPAWLDADVQALRAAAHPAGRGLPDEVLRLDLEPPMIRRIATGVAAYAGRPDAAVPLVQPLLRSHNREVRADGLTWMAALDAGRGRPRAALAHLAELEAYRPVVARGMASLVRSASTFGFGGDREGTTLQGEPAGSPPRPGVAVAAAERFALASRLARDGRTAEALRWFDTFPSDELTDAWLVPLAHLERARINDRAGRHEAAVWHYERFAQAWPAPEPELAALVDSARAAIERLRSAPR